MSGYAESLKAAGVEILFFETVGSYQGKWLCVARLPGETEPKALIDYYGSCSGCDAYEAEMDYESHTVTDHNLKETWHSPTDASDAVPGCEKCAAFLAKLKAFGEKYLPDFEPVAKVKAELVAALNEEYVDLDDRELADAMRRYEAGAA